MKKIEQHIRNNRVSSLFNVLTLTLMGLWLAGNTLAASVQPTFPSAAAAAQSLFESVQRNDESAIALILGGPTDLTTSTDPGQDKADRELFARKYQEMHRLGHEPDGSVTLYVGAENWPFPVPLVNENGTWRFDPAVGQVETLYRRIGENELAAIVNCEEFAASESHHAAVAAASKASASETVIAKVARGSAAADPILLNGYYFRLVALQGAPGGTRRDTFLVAYPAEYRVSGVMTFVAAAGGIVYEKDLGANTAQLASQITSFPGDSTWRPAGE